MTKFLQASHRFWLVVVCLHHQIPILPSDDAQNKRDPSFLADEDYFLLEHVPLYKLATFLFLHMDKKSSKHRAKPSFDAVYDRLESETHALNFVKANLDLLVSLVLDTSLTADDAIITAPQLDLLGVLFCGGASYVQQYPRLSAAYPKWQQPQQLASKVLKWLRTRLALNDVLYPQPSDASADAAVVLQTPLQFTEVCVPVKMDAVSPRGRLPVALPIEFEHAVRRAQDNVDCLRRLIDEFDTPVKKVLEQAIQAKFKEWLVVSGNMRQVLDLVQLEKARQHAV
ncbi:hypothetical protein DYB37_003124 [Aphanomyces astaci]|uniref:Uncharacterized protein n=1 Tax=Aphanomyces astaci TaxID=112090 RepID=A0A3R7EC83_APHAT|nr:hypothetical protein DYB35_002297 [Aphanomyces astaci]RHZ24943.1 hypothetical protein DYB37_003124 [Aphanomyces astaci]